VAYENILVDRDGPIGVITLNRPPALNALSSGLQADMGAALDDFEQDNEIRAIVLWGGERVFSAGADLKEMGARDQIDMLNPNRLGMWDRVRRVTKPIIAAVSGYALGGGCELAMVCDMILASDTARFGQPEIKVGLIPGAGGTQRLARAIGKQKAMEMVLTGSMIDAREAERHGLVNKVVPVEALLDEAKRLGLSIAAQPPISVRLAKELVTKAVENDIQPLLDYERKVFALLFGTEDSREGVRAFAEKRAPVYKGR
jgi:enoyl-CoA hydratase